jgi:hypothetical protein
VAAGTPAGWVAADEVYGGDARLRARIRGHGLEYVMQIAANRQVTTRAGKIAVRDLAAGMPDSAWQTYSAGEGSKGHRYYSWTLIGIDPEPEPATTRNAAIVAATGGEQMLLVRRNDITGELAYHLCFAPELVPMTTLVRVAGQRWRIEENVQAAKGFVGLDQHQVATLGLLAPLDHPGHARPRVPHRPRRPSPRPAASSTPSQASAPEPSSTPSPGPTGDDDTKPEPAPRTTIDASPQVNTTIYGCSSSRAT